MTEDDIRSPLQSIVTIEEKLLDNRQVKASRGFGLFHSKSHTRLHAQTG
ncbi:MAG: hypothetical protein QXE96_03150 [Candidatus Caldarchaeum sp.]